MKCPKCGSEDIEIIEKKDYGSNFVYIEEVKTCANCECKVEKYQQRLDKVLTKFYTRSKNILQYVNGVQIVYYKLKKRFEIGGEKIELDTVECLIRDLDLEAK